ncbi:Pycsar system effector family protein [Spirosoma sp. KUDC1026]|uniref:Pycsar system effector family protein n=1 Tax=Spirosoma sp. KUDC1026 TaxID=2745947 RepID=UPI00159B9112|nr:Pycsar system effector family protein [Spirosoma sp. KUDC1026]QKZ14976.1 HD domain-containing protein [Spirosoma sp. KUDC1026]
MNKGLLQRIEAYVTQLFGESASPLPYHSLAHTRDVVRAAKTLADHYRLSDELYLAVMTAAWFHDTGYVLARPEQHEEKSAEIAAEFLRENTASTALIEKVQQCILATRMPQSPIDLPEEIICDADLFHLGNADYKERSKQLRTELEQLKGHDIPGKAWRQGNIDFLKNHRYFTDYARTIQDAGKADNLRQLEDKKAEKEQKSSPAPATPQPIEANQSQPKSEKKNKDSKPDRGVETMFRTTSTNHLRLSEIADSKANIMISVNSIMISVVVSVLSHRLEENPHLVLPTTLFLITSLMTIIFAILATRPNVTRGTFSKEDIQHQKANLLFFGNFYNMSLEEYEMGINAMMNDSEFLYGSMTRDIYYLGVVLGRKYKLLRITYNIFMFGFIVSVLAFLAVFLIYD